MQLDSIEFACPWCGEINPLALDPEEMGQRVTQDCVVCCAPIELVVPSEPGLPMQVEREND